MPNYETIQLKRQNDVLTVVLNLPASHNAINRRMLDELTNTFAELTEEQSIRVVIITGNGRSFCAGADLSMMKESAEATYEENKQNALAIFDLMQVVNNCPKPVVARVNGAAFGGGVGLVACCDIAIAVESARFGFSEVRLGLVPSVISPFVLNKVGSTHARELFLSGERFDARHAKEIGLIHHVVAPDELDLTVAEKVRRLLDAAPAAQRSAKELLRRFDSVQVSDYGDFTSDLIARLRASEEGQEGMTAFLEKRHPKWRI